MLVKLGPGCVVLWIDESKVQITTDQLYQTREDLSTFPRIIPIEFWQLFDYLLGGMQMQTQMNRIETYQIAVCMFFFGCWCCMDYHAQPSSYLLFSLGYATAERASLSFRADP